MKSSELRPWLQRFFCEYLPNQRNVSRATILAYRDTFRLLLPHIKNTVRTPAGPMSLEAFAPENIIRFLDSLEHQRKNTIRTRNARLAAIRSFVHYLNDWVGPELPSCVPRILAIPFKRHAKPMLGFLSRREIEAILSATDDSWTGRRDHLLVQLLYNTGARISEILALRVKDVSPGAQQVEVLGKGRKHRVIPLWRQTQARLRRWIQENGFSPDAPLLPNRFGQRLGSAGAAYQLRKLVTRASAEIPALKKRRVSPHTFRHSTAMSMLEAGVSLEVIALFLGHENPATTHQYLEASLAMKKQTLEKISKLQIRSRRFRPSDDLLQFLNSL